MALSLLFFGCERDEVQKPNIEMLSQQAAMNLFFKNYTSKEDEFRDKVVERLLAVNDSTGIIYDLARKYGQPEWLAKQSRTAKSDTYLAVPVCIPYADSVSAVFIFLEQDSTLHLKIFEASNPDSLISSLVLHYQCSLFPTKKYTRFTIPVKDNSKDGTWVTSCWFDFATADWIQFWVTEATCIQKIVYEPTLDLGLGDLGGSGNSDDIGDGTSAGGTTGGTSPNTTSLSSDAKNNLNNAKNKLEQGPCISKTVIRSTWNNGLYITIGNINGVSSYKPSTGIITFSSLGAITDNNLLHELLHAYQAKLYGKNYTHTQTHEFEAWLLVDLYLISQGNDMNNLTWSNNLTPEGQKTYYNWLNSILSLGTIHCTLGDYNLCEIFRDELVKRNPTYASYNVGSGNLSTINGLLSKCN